MFKIGSVRMRERYISQLVIRRLPKYHRCLKELEKRGETRVSSSALARALGFTASQVRQDFSCFGGFGQQGYGYNVSGLLSEIASIIGVDRAHRAVIIGVGNLGHALLNNFNFQNCGFSVTAAFDAASERIGEQIGDVVVHNIDELESFYKENPFEIAVLTMPKKFVSDIADRLIKLGIKGIWNFTNVDLNLDEFGITVENVHFSDSLMILCYGISDTTKE